MRTFHLIMNNELKQKFPQWANENEKGKYNLCMSDDLDSFISCFILNQLFGYEITYFYSFTDIYQSITVDKKEVIGVDIALEHGKCWDNHVTRINSESMVNPQSANLNNIQMIHSGNYANKYSGSTLLQIMSYYDIPLPKDKEMLMVLLAIDSSYLGHYSTSDYFAMIHYQMMKSLGYDQVNTFLDTVTKMDFNRMNQTYNLKDKIRVDQNGHLQTNIKLKELSRLFKKDFVLPIDHFIHKQALDNKITRINEHTIKPDTGIFSLALTGKDKCKYSIVV
ncbi:hypothetical protein [Paenibacillus sp. WLX2291]|uniref:hypothetical protein n=1 Tax=Paenibacillus sp. WLX2291 TaxID=3296934 RepID=UPI0039845243